jgi:hypothetical protein
MADTKISALPSATVPLAGTEVLLLEFAALPQRLQDTANGKILRLHNRAGHADGAGMVRIANGIIPWKEGGAAFDYFSRVVKPRTDQGGEMIYWERAEGGRVFNAGSIGSGWVLSADPRWTAVMRNVLAHFGVEKKATRP